MKLQKLSQLGNAILGGTGRSGSTWLFRTLATHDQLCPSVVKELRFFIPRDPQTELHREAYLKRFCRPRPQHRWTLEGTPAYLHNSFRVVAAAARVVPDARWVFLLRNPADRLRSVFGNHRTTDPMFAGETFESFASAALESFHEGLLPEVSLDRPDTLPERAARFLRAGCYARFLEDFYAAFDAAQIRVGFFEQVQQNPKELIAAIADFLEIDPEGFHAERVGIENQTRDYRFGRLHSFAAGINARLEPWLNRVPGVRRRLRSWYGKVNVATPQQERSPCGNAESTGVAVGIKEATPVEQQLLDFYRPHNHRLASLLRQHRCLGPFPAWLSDDV